MLNVHMEEDCVRVLSEIAKNLVVSVLPGTAFNYKSAKGFFPAVRMTVPYNSQPVTILIVHKASADSRAITKNTNVNDGILLA